MTDLWHACQVVSAGPGHLQGRGRAGQHQQASRSPCLQPGRPLATPPPHQRPPWPRGLQVNLTVALDMCCCEALCILGLGIVAPVSVIIVFKSEVMTARLANQCATRRYANLKQRIGNRKTHLSQTSGSKINSEHQSSSWREIEDL